MIIRKETLQAVLPATTKDDTRYFLSAVLVEPDGRCLATNGHIMLIATDPHPWPDEDYPTVEGKPFNGSPEKGVLIPSDQVQSLIKVLPKKSTIPILSSVQISKNGESGASVVATNLQAVSSTHVQENGKDQTFPKYERVMVPADRPHLSVCLSVEVLKALIKSCEATTDGRLQTITFELPTEHQHQGRKSVLDHTFNRRRDSTGIDGRAEAGHEICEHCGQIEKEHVVPDGQITGPIRVHYGTEVKVEGVVMPCRI